MNTSIFLDLLRIPSAIFIFGGKISIQNSEIKRDIFQTGQLERKLMISP